MNDISPINRPNASVLNRSNHAHRPNPTVGSPSRGSDKVELSPEARMLSKLKNLPDVRQDLVDRVRQQIASGTYETPDKVEALLDGLAQELF